jgi:hypothetical protein
VTVRTGLFERLSIALIATLSLWLAQMTPVMAGAPHASAGIAAYQVQPHILRDQQGKANLAVDRSVKAPAKVHQLDGVDAGRQAQAYVSAIRLIAQRWSSDRSRALRILPGYRARAPPEFVMSTTFLISN